MYRHSKRNSLYHLSLQRIGSVSSVIPCKDQGPLPQNMDWPWLAVADKLAVAGAAVHEPPSEVVAAARDRRAMAGQVQQMMLAILLERQSCEKELADAADRESDMGDDADMLSMDVDDDCTEFNELLDDEFDTGAAS